ncbi:MAG: hypothetical protein AAFX87_20235 [Bacteroidota bacterium]
MNTITMFALSGNLTLLDYQISHSQLLLRSEDGLYNIDVIFTGVAYMDLKVSLANVVIRSSNFDERAALVKKVILPNGFNCYTIEWEKGKNYVIAGRVEVYKNQLDFNASSLIMDMDKQDWEFPK